MSHAVKHITIVGGGSAGWLSAGLIAAEHQGDSAFKVTLIESPEVNSIGVGEGTWPTMRATLQKIGISETDFLNACDASFKQGSKFSGWLNGNADDHYYHPFTLPAGFGDTNLVPHWQPLRDKVSFANAVSVQGYLCDRGLAPKTNTTPEYAALANYGYHLDAGKFAQLLQRHCCDKLGVRHIRDHVTRVNGASNGDIASVSTKHHGEIGGDLFIDCSGFAALLLGQHYGIPFISKKHILFNDSALALQLPYRDADSAIASHTLSTAQQAGWIWDIGLPTRRGVGYAYSSAHSSDAAAEQTLRNYIAPTLGNDAATVELRKIAINPGQREKFWHRNCVAIGMSAGFLEPLEASALVMIELAAQMLSTQMPANRAAMDIVATRYNEKFSYRWARVIDFLKLHYLLSQRDDSPYWRDNRHPDSVPDSLQQLVTLWRHAWPWHHDFSHNDEIFSSASYQYVLYGMGFCTEAPATSTVSRGAERAIALFSENNRHANELLQQLPGNRQLLNRIKQYGLQKI